MPGFKFHIVTVVGIFVALALGIVVGTSLSDNIIIESQMSTIELMQNRINTLETDRSNLIEQTQELAEDIKQLRLNEERLFDVAMDNFQNMDNITVIAYGDSLEILDLPIVKNNKLYFENIILVDYEALSNSEGLEHFLQVEQNINRVFSEKLANFIHSEDDLSIRYLEELQVISFNGSYDFSNQKFLVYFKGNNEEDELLKVTAERLHGLNQRVVAVSDLGSRSFANLSTNIDQIAYIGRTTSQIDLLERLVDDARQVSGN